MNVEEAGREGRSDLWRMRRRASAIFLAAACVAASAACEQIRDRMSVRPRLLRDVPAERLAFRFEPDFDTSGLLPSFTDDEPEEPLATVRTDFETRRPEERLVRTVASPDGQRALALYQTTETPEGDFRMDLYAADGKFIRNILPPDLSGAFIPTVAWSPDGRQIAFIGIKNSAAPPSPTPVVPDAPAASGAEPLPAAPDAAPTVAPLIAPVATFGTEQIYVGDRDGFSLRPLTTRDGLIYFQFTWAPDSHAVAAIACKEDEWNARRVENKTPAGRPRLISVKGEERLLSDSLAEATPAWSPDSSKVATSFGTDVAVYDTLTETPTAALIALNDLLLSSSLTYDARLPQKQEATNTNANTNSQGKAGGDPAAAESSPAATATPPQASLSFNPVVRLEWLQPETLLVQTAFLRVYKNEPVRNYPRWHVLHLSPQAAVL